MAYLIFLFIIIFLFAMSRMIEKEIQNKVFIITAFVSLMLFVVFQEKIGYDHDSYTKIFNEVINYSWAELSKKGYGEIGFKIVVKIFGAIDPNPDLFIRVFMSVTIALFGIGCLKYSKQPLIFIFGFLAFLYVRLSGLRQARAAAILFLGYSFIRDRKFVKYLLTVFVAMLFHASAIVAIVLYPVCIFDKSSMYYRIVMVVGIILMIGLKEQVIELGKKIVDLIEPRYKVYLTSKDFALNIILILTMFTIALTLLAKRDKKFNSSINLMLLAVAVAATSAITYEAGRLMLYFLPTALLSMDEIFDEKIILHREELPIVTTTYVEKKMIGILFVAFFIFYWYYTFISLSKNTYHFIGG